MREGSVPATTALSVPVFDAHAHLDAMAERAGAMPTTRSSQE